MCARHFCATCGEEMIHRDNRKWYESSSAMGQIMHREGPQAMSFCDLDGISFRGRYGLLRGLEHKTEEQSVGLSQSMVLRIIDECIKSAIANPSEKLKDLVWRAPWSDTRNLHADSGVFLVRGALGPTGDMKMVDFVGPQVVSNIDGSNPKEMSKKEFFDWVNGDDKWSPRKNQFRNWENSWGR